MLRQVCSAGTRGGRGSYVRWAQRVGLLDCLRDRRAQNIAELATVATGAARSGVRRRSAVATAAATGMSSGGSSNGCWIHHGGRYDLLLTLELLQLLLLLFRKSVLGIVDGVLHSSCLLTVTRVGGFPSVRACRRYTAVAQLRQVCMLLMQGSLELCKHRVPNARRKRCRQLAVMVELLLLQ
jgi:hypothetical protein